jgi:hypothetical protein
VFGIDAQELVLPGFDFAAKRLLEAQTLVFPLLGLLAELRDQIGLVLILRVRVAGRQSRRKTSTMQTRWDWAVLTTTRALSA